MPVDLQSKGFFSDQCLNAFTLNVAITFQSANILFKIQPKCPAQQSHRFKSCKILAVLASCNTFLPYLLQNIQHQFDWISYLERPQQLRAFGCTTSIAASPRIVFRVYRCLPASSRPMFVFQTASRTQLEKVGTSWNKLLRQVLYHRQLLKHCKAGAFVSWKRATFWQPTSCLQTFTNKLRIRKDPFQNKYDYSIYPICFQILMRYGIGPGAPLLAVLHPAMSSSSACQLDHHCPEFVITKNASIYMHDMHK